MEGKVEAVFLADAHERGIAAYRVSNTLLGRAGRIPVGYCPATPSHVYEYSVFLKEPHPKELSARYERRFGYYQEKSNGKAEASWPIRKIPDSIYKWNNIL